jgi:hypothetical protein
MPDYESLLERIRQSPYEHLGRRSVSEIGCYLMGYDTARRFWGLPLVPHCLSGELYKKWLDSKVHLCRQSLETFCLLLAEDEREAFDLFFEFQDLKLEECKDDFIHQEDLESKNFNQDKAIKSRTLIDFILDEEGIRKRPAMYFGNRRQVSGLWAMCSGFLWTERDLGIKDSSDAMNMEFFQLWLDERYPIAKGQPWDKLFYFEALGSESEALKRFYEDFEMFLEGREANSPPKWVEIAIENIKKQADNQE